MEYQILEDGTIFKEDTQQYIPPVHDNADYIRYLEWLAEQETP